MKSLYGHITVATFLPDNDKEFLQTCSEVIQGTFSFCVHYEKIEVLRETSVVVATPSGSDALLSLHSRIAERFAGSLDRWTGGPDWHPHTTLLYAPAADPDMICRDMQRHFIPFDACINQIEFSKVEETGYTILKTIHLPSKA